MPLNDLYTTTQSLSVQQCYMTTGVVVKVMPRLHQDTCCRIQVVSTCRRLHVSCIGDKILASLSPVCCWIQRHTSRPWHKWIVVTNYVARDEQLVSVDIISWCKCGIRIVVLKEVLMLRGGIAELVNLYLFVMTQRQSFVMFAHSVFSFSFILFDLYSFYCTFCTILIMIIIIITIGRLAFCFNGFLFWFSALTRFW